MSIRIMGQAQAAMNALQQKLDTIGHNLANSNTQGYKARQVEFQSLLKQQIYNLNDSNNLRGRRTPDGIRVGAGAKIGSTNTDLSIGSMQTTERSLDTMLLHENHFYQINVERDGINEMRYTRSGAFYVTPLNDGQTVQLVTSEGYPVYGEDGPIRFNNEFDAIHINERGEVIVTYGTNDINVGRLSIVEITRPRLLQAVGENSFRLPNLEQLGYDFNEIVRIPTEDLLVQNKALEMSNVSIQDEMTEMIIAQRAYQLNAKSITTADQMQGLVNQLR